MGILRVSSGICFSLTALKLLVWTPLLVQADKVEAACQSNMLDATQMEDYKREGFIVLRDLLDESLVPRLSEAGESLSKQRSPFPVFFAVMERGVLFNGGKDQAEEEEEDLSAAFREVALYSQIPQIVAELMELDPESQNLRVIRDVFLAKDMTEESCGWHVDDHGFWPQSFLSGDSNAPEKEASASRTLPKKQQSDSGVNVWIALDDMPMEFQGSMALSSGSHEVSWRHEAYEAIGQNRSVDGGHAREDIVARLENRKTGTVGLGACGLATIRPDLSEKLDQNEVRMDLKRGDMIFSTRDLFHRTMDVTPQGLSYYQEKLGGRQVLNRYSIRYAPGTAKLPNGWLAEWSVTTNSSNTGLSLDEIVDNGSITWYPKVWPSTDVNLNQQLDDVAKNYLEEAKQKVSADIVDLFSPKLSAVEEAAQSTS